MRSNHQSIYTQADNADDESKDEVSDLPWVSPRQKDDALNYLTEEDQQENGGWEKK